jgi:hypothetical protein
MGYQGARAKAAATGAALLLLLLLLLLQQHSVLQMLVLNVLTASGCHTVHS